MERQDKNMLGANYKGHDLIFIISQPRSGSTLLQRVLAGHPDVATSAETWLMLHPVYESRKRGLSAEYGAEFRREAVEEFVSNYCDDSDVLDQARRAWAEVVYGNALSSAAKTFFLDKTPRYFYIIPDLYRLFPEAKFIFLIRNPMAVLYSELTTYVKEDWSLLSVFGPDLVDAPALILEGMEQLGSDAIQVRYEEFVENPQGATELLCSQLGISFSDGMVNYGDTPAPIGKMNDPVGIHKHTSPSTQSLEKWKAMTENRQMAYFAQAYLHNLGEDIISRLGYSFSDILNALGPEVNPRSERLFPWPLAVTPPERWSFRDWYQAETYLKVSESSSFTGRLKALKSALRKAREHWRSANSTLIP